MKKFYLISSLSVLSLSAISAAPQKKKNISINNEICEFIKVNGAEVKVCVSGVPTNSQVPREDLGLIQLKAKTLIKKLAAKNSPGKAVYTEYPAYPTTIQETNNLDSDDSYYTYYQLPSNTMSNEGYVSTDSTHTFDEAEVERTADVTSDGDFDDLELLDKSTQMKESIRINNPTVNPNDI